MKTEDEEEQVTEDEIRMMIDLGNENGAIDAEEKELLQNVFEFGDLSVSDAMTRVGDVTAIQVDTPPGEVLDVIRATGLSRFPVYGSDLNDILGILNARDLLLDMASSRHRTVRELMRPAYLVPETLSADDPLPGYAAQKGTSGGGHRRVRRIGRCREPGGSVGRDRRQYLR